MFKETAFFTLLNENVLSRNGFQQSCVLVTPDPVSIEEEGAPVVDLTEYDKEEQVRQMEGQ